MKNTMSDHLCLFIVVLQVSLALMLACSAPCLGNTDTFVIDSERSRLSYISPNAFPGRCRTQCDFQLSGSFAGEFGQDFMTISDPRLGIGGENADEVDLASLQLRFPRRASVFDYGFLSLDTPILDVLAGYGGAFAARRDNTIKLVAGNLNLWSDGPSYRFDVTVYTTNELDCNGDGEVTFEDVQCAQDQSKLLTALDYTNTPLGDTDGDQVVGFHDFLNLSTHFGHPGGYLQGDLDLNGFVEFADFLVLSANFGAGDQKTLAAVPEPKSSPLLLAAVLLFTALRGMWRTAIH